MMKMSTTKVNGNSNNNNNNNIGHDHGDGNNTENWEVRPSGMLVQKRIELDQNSKPLPTVRVRVKYGSVYHDVHIHSQATFGELKKKLSGATGLHHEDQKVYYKEKERNSKEFLDFVGVKDKSKLVLVEDPISKEKRFIEMKRNANIQKAAKSISKISLEVDKLASQVADFESVISRGRRVAELDIVSLIELLMNELIKLDGIVADGDVKLQRKMQVRRVQKYVETLDMLKVKNSTPAANGVHKQNGNHQNVPSNPTKTPVSNNQDRTTTNTGKPPLSVRRQPRQQQKHSIGHSPLRPQPQLQQEQTRHSTSETVVTTQWETFDSTPPLIVLSPTRSLEPAPQMTEKPKFPWD